MEAALVIIAMLVLVDIALSVYAAWPVQVEDEEEDGDLDVSSPLGFASYEPDDDDWEDVPDEVPLDPPWEV